MLPSADKFYGKAHFLLQQDLPTVPKQLPNGLAHYDITVLDLPANSPDLNHIDNQSGFVKKKKMMMMRNT